VETTLREAATAAESATSMHSRTYGQERRAGQCGQATLHYVRSQGFNSIRLPITTHGGVGLRKRYREMSCGSNDLRRNLSAPAVDTHR
jgi:hypothetical protein